MLHEDVEIGAAALDADSNAMCERFRARVQLRRGQSHLRSKC